MVKMDMTKECATDTALFHWNKRTCITNYCSTLIVITSAKPKEPSWNCTDLLGDLTWKKYIITIYSDTPWLMHRVLPPSVAISGGTSDSFNGCQEQNKDDKMLSNGVLTCLTLLMS